MIPFIDLKAQHARLEQDIRQAMDRVLLHGQFIMGPEVVALERQLADFAGVQHVVTCSSGTDALLLALMAWEVGPGDAVFTTPYTFIATAEVISLSGGTPVFVDVTPSDCTLDPARLEAAVEQVRSKGELRPRCVIPVDIYGLPADYEAINKVAAREGLLVLEDAAQSFGARYQGRRAGSLAHAAATSFFPAKPLGCYGDGGAVLTDDEQLAETMRSLRVHGKGGHKYDNVRIGINGRLDTLQAAILLQKLRIFPEELQRREAVARAYVQGLQGIEDLTLPPFPHDRRSAWAQFTIFSKERDRLQQELRQAGIPTAIYYPRPLHLQTAFRDLGYTQGDMPVAEACSRTTLSLPMHPYLAPDEVARICEAVASIVG